MVIREIQIKNFRSIRNMTISARKHNVIVGLNDVGKSNILRALNLFFNNQTDNGKAYDFDYDFAYHFPAKSKKTKEVVIAVAQFASTDCPFRMNGAGSSVEAV